MQCKAMISIFHPSNHFQALLILRWLEPINQAHSKDSRFAIIQYQGANTNNLAGLRQQLSRSIIMIRLLQPFLMWGGGGAALRGVLLFLQVSDLSTSFCSISQYRKMADGLNDLIYN